MKIDRRAGRKSAVKRKRDRRARLYGLAYLLLAVGLGVLHDRILRLPHSRFGHDCEQIILGSMLVLGLLGGFLLVEGSRLFEGALGTSRDLQRSRQASAKLVRPDAPRGSEFDTRSGVALLLAKRALAAASERRSTTGTVIKHHPS